jgi:hypothetical protein
MSLVSRCFVLLVMAAPALAIAQDGVGANCLEGGSGGHGCFREDGSSGCEFDHGCGFDLGCGLDLGSLLVSDDKLLGIFGHSDPCFNDFISPMTNPVFFEDPRTLTEARFIFLNHHLPNSLGGDNVQVMAMQARMALTDNLSIIATKDGFITSQSALLNDGWADVAAGLKYNIFRYAESQTIASVGATFEMPVGSSQALQGNGDGEFHLFASGGTEFLEDWHFVTGSGFRLPVDRDAENQMWYWSNHLDRQLGDSGLYLFTEVNWFHYMSNGTAFPAPIGGHDLFNLGSLGMAGENLVTGAYGVKYKPSQNTELGVAYEIPYSKRKDLIQDRITVDFILRF